MTETKAPVLFPGLYIPHAESVCAECGARGCLIPVPHKRHA